IRLRFDGDAGGNGDLSKVVGRTAAAVVELRRGVNQRAAYQSLSLDRKIGEPSGQRSGDSEVMGRLSGEGEVRVCEVSLKHALGRVCVRVGATWADIDGDPHRLGARRRDIES